MKDKIKFEDIFDLTDIEKTFEQTIEYDLLKLMEKWENEKKDQQRRQQIINEEDEHIKEIVRKVLKEELQKMLNSKGLFGEKFLRELELQGFSRNCIGCLYAEKNYAMAKREY